MCYALKINTQRDCAQRLRCQSLWVMGDTHTLTFVDFRALWRFLCVIFLVEVRALKIYVATPLKILNNLIAV